MDKLISKTIGYCLKERAEKTPGIIGLSYRDYSYSWREIDEISDFLAVKYLKYGIKKGTHVGIWSVNTPNWVFAYFALVKLGAIAILINTCYKETELEKILKYSDVEYIFYGNGIKDLNYKDILDKINISNLPKLKNTFPLEKNDDIKWYRRSDYPSDMPVDDCKKLIQAINQVNAKDTASIMFTSGTTKSQKGVLLSHYNLVNNSLSISRQMGWNEQDKICVAVRLFHCFGITAGILSAVHSGSCIHLIKYYKTCEVLNQIEKYKCTVLNGVPTMFMAIVRNSKLKDYDISSVKSGIIAGSAIHSEEYINICKILNLKYLQPSYGQTETSPCITISALNDSIEKKAVSVGKSIDNVEVKIWNCKENRESKEGELGEILTRGYHVMKGYYKMPLETDEVIDSTGWLHTGDLGFIDKEGYLYVKGRIKEIIIRGGENISPVEIEYYIKKLPSIKEVKVIGVEAEVLQEEIVACVVPKENCEVSKEEVQAIVSKYLTAYKVPKYVLVFDKLPTTSSGKIKLGKLKKIVEERINNKEEYICILQNNMT
ncbi:AMP-binding protein [Clostridium sp. NSJ-6]|uniref:AMP-binding protein n=1 Tax=Clostridium hominis TaxID=2763036 RepID=A0ABR7DDM9_9CLOT|nr:AMP-binding protein [Clostridium hominis]MBC5629501.1 AMP-binding protein [Clostridium hominis]